MQDQESCARMLLQLRLCLGLCPAAVCLSVCPHGKHTLQQVQRDLNPSAPRKLPGSGDKACEVLLATITGHLQLFASLFWHSTSETRPVQSFARHVYDSHITLSGLEGG